jgi:hypothetical protein
MDIKEFIQTPYFIPAFLLSAGMIAVAIALYLEENFPAQEAESKIAFFVWIWKALTAAGGMFNSAAF